MLSQDQFINALRLEQVMPDRHKLTDIERNYESNERQSGGLSAGPFWTTEDSFTGEILYHNI